MAKEKKEEIKLDETNVDLTKPLEEQDTEPSKEDEKENISKEDTEKKEDAKQDAKEEETTETDEEVKEVEETEKEEEKKEEPSKNEVLDLDNKLINEDVIKESEEVPVGFVPPIPVVEKTKETLKNTLSENNEVKIYPIQDLLLLGNESRMNTPGTTENNWKFKFTWEELDNAEPLF